MFKLEICLKLIVSLMISTGSLFSDGRIIGDFLINPKDYLGNDMIYHESLTAYTTSHLTNEFNSILNNGALSGLGEFVAYSSRMRSTNIYLNNDGQIVVSSWGTFTPAIPTQGQQIYVIIQDSTEATGLSYEIEHYISSKWYVYTHPTFVDPTVDIGTSYVNAIYDLMPIGISDSDKDGVADTNDVFPYNPNESTDIDGDGVGDNSDKHPGFNDEDLEEYLNLNQYLRSSDIQDLRPGSTMIEVFGNQATVQLQMEESSDLQTWEDTGTPATMTIPADTDTKFFRFKMAE